MLLLLTVVAEAPAASRENQFRKSVIKIYSTVQQYDYAMPWQGGPPMRGTGSGVILKGKKILTNAHVVSDARFIEVQRSRQAKRYAARVSFIAHDCDLAILEVDDPEFYKGTSPPSFSEALPKLNDEVVAVGYPLGGTRLSMTRGVVSRIDYNVYTHSGADQHLVLQVDAAINPGNSGGPVFFGGNVVGIAFSGLSNAENIGYAIPVPVVNRFLKDIEDGKYHGYPELGVATLDLRNAAMRKNLKLPDNEKGVVVHYVDRFGAAKGKLKNNDVLLSIGDLPIDNDGTIEIDGNNVEFAELLERRQWGDSMSFTVWRNATKKQIDVPLRNPTDPYAYKNIYDKRPEYYIVGGIVFCPLTQEYLRTLGMSMNTLNGQQVLYYSRYAKIDNLCEDRDEFVVVTRRLPHAVNAYHSAFAMEIVASVNGRKIANLRQFKDAIETNEGDFHVIKFENSDRDMIIDASAAKAAAPAIMQEYGIPSLFYLEEESK
jgi:S1-C subfamily serine protease